MNEREGMECYLGNRPNEYRYEGKFYDRRGTCEDCFGCQAADEDPAKRLAAFTNVSWVRSPLACHGITFLFD